MRSSILRWHVGMAALCVLLLAGCAEQRLRATVEQMRAAIEARDVREAMAPVAEDFVGEHGMDAAGARRLLQLQLLGHQTIGVTVGPVDVQMQGSTATVRFSVLLTGGGRWLPDQAQHYQVTTGWRLRGSTTHSGRRVAGRKGSHVSERDHIG
ncbi:nuclear transport factor 2 family protein [Xanthomonas campestris pv. raphani]|uniref:nuclear transport factor 2 family protein n=1 Tax=Xanthomonas campestris TaxID=339 RepID=UPI002B233EFE|nr:nuclear transport factor 2 family protein [Xanthomonas campestris]MEA9752374.1 nuclear transport factor 2 family protein [Xanthomonas campestris pv. raphani]MEA9812630.1 nuclear transport factor 2 family protein [Xanthomonas campestris pv. raphani]